jgi:hypothetical protein
MEKLVGLYLGIIDRTETIYLRYLHNKVDWNNRLQFWAPMERVK